MVKPISPDTSRRLLDSTTAVCTKVAEGTDPTAAMIKIARENNLTSGQIELASRAYNAGVVTAARKHGESFMDKIAAPQLIDVHSVVNDIFPENIKLSSGEVDSMYFATVRPKEKALAKVAADLGASAKIPSHKKNADCSCGCGGKGECKQVQMVEKRAADWRKARELLKDLDKLSHDIYMAEAKADAAVRVLTKAAKATEGSKAAAMAYYLNYAANEYGAAGAALVDGVTNQALNPLEREEYHSVRKVAQVAPLSGGLHQAIDDAYEAHKDLLLKLAHYPLNVIKVRYDIQQLIPRTAKQAELGSLSLLDSEKDADYTPIKIAEDGLMGAVKGFFGGDVDPADQAALERDALLRLSDPEHEAKIKAIRIRGMLQDLANSDNVVSSHTPQEVATSFNELYRTAPNIAMNPSLLRANLRRTLQGNLSPFEAKEVVTSANMLDPTRSRPAGSF
jgi:hypothetical protein